MLVEWRRVRRTRLRASLAEDIKDSQDISEHNSDRTLVARPTLVASASADGGGHAAIVVLGPDGVLTQRMSRRPSIFQFNPSLLPLYLFVIPPFSSRYLTNRQDRVLNQSITCTSNTRRTLSTNNLFFINRPDNLGIGGAITEDGPGITHRSHSNPVLVCIV